MIKEKFDKAQNEQHTGLQKESRKSAQINKTGYKKEKKKEEKDWQEGKNGDNENQMQLPYFSSDSYDTLRSTSSVVLFCHVWSLILYKSDT